jgi:hypothetical protein
MPFKNAIEPPESERADDWGWVLFRRKTVRGARSSAHGFCGVLTHRCFARWRVEVVKDFYREAGVVLRDHNLKALCGDDGRGSPFATKESNRLPLNARSRSNLVVPSA